MGRPTSVLRRRQRPAAAIAVLAVLAAYFAFADWLPGLPLWADVVLTSAGVLPLAFSLTWIALPLRRARGLLLLAIALGVLGAAWHAADWFLAAGLAKGAAASALAFWFLSYFERLSWVVIVAAIIPLVDAASVWRGPTHHIVTERPHVFDALSVGFPVTGERFVTLRWEPPEGGKPNRYNVYRSGPTTATPHRINRRPLPGDADGFTDGGESTHHVLSYVVESVWPDGTRSRSSVVVAPEIGEDTPEPAPPPDSLAPRVEPAESAPTTFNLGLPDILFFALFLAAAARWQLRVAATWLVMLVSFAVTMSLAIWVDPFGIGGLPALPGLSIAFLLANADLLWRRLRSGED